MKGSALYLNILLLASVLLGPSLPTAAASPATCFVTRVLAETVSVPSGVIALVKGLSNETQFSKWGPVLTDPGYRRVVDRLSEPERRQAIAYVLKKIAEIDQSPSQLSQRIPGGISGPKGKKRNLEELHALLTRKERKALLVALESGTSSVDAISAMNRYYRDSLPGLSGARGNYGAEQVLSVARAVQSQFGTHLDEGTRSIRLHGSFPNGKTSISTSDLDFLMSDALLDDYARLWKLDAVARLPAHWEAPLVPSNYAANEKTLFQDAVSFQKSLAAAEKQAALRLNPQREFKTGQILTILPARATPASPVRDEIIGRFNPILIRIHRQSIAIEVFDLEAKTTKAFRINMN